MRVVYILYIVTALLRYLRRTAEPQNRRTAEPQIRICGSAVLRFDSNSIIFINAIKRVGLSWAKLRIA